MTSFDPLHPTDEFREHIARLVDDAPPLPAAARDLWRRAKENADDKRKPLVVAPNPDVPQPPAEIPADVPDEQVAS